MTAPAVAWPTSRHVLGWWNSVANFHPRRLWLSHLRLHHVEALVAAARPCHMLPLPATLLRIVDLMDGSAEDLSGQLHLDATLLRQMLQGLAEEGLIQTTGGRCALTAAARQALREGTVPAAVRRDFYFLDRSELKRRPHFVPLTEAQPVALGPVPDWQFDPAVLQECADRDPAWKRCFGFPMDVKVFVPPGATPANGIPEWQGIVLDRPEQMPALLVEIPGDPKTPRASRLVGFAVTTADWSVRWEPPALELGEQWAEAFGELTADPESEAWRQAWRAWCQPRSIPAGEADACRFEPAGIILRVHAPRKLVDRLKAARSDAVKNEAWLLAGTGRTRALARIELHGQG